MFHILRILIVEAASTLSWCRIFYVDPLCGATLPKGLAVDSRTFGTEWLRTVMHQHRDAGGADEIGVVLGHGQGVNVGFAGMIAQHDQGDAAPILGAQPVSNPQVASLYPPRRGDGRPAVHVERVVGCHPQAAPVREAYGHQRLDTIVDHRLHSLRLDLAGSRILRQHLVANQYARECHQTACSRHLGIGGEAAAGEGLLHGGLRVPARS